jgi:N utilization substance protein B
VIRVGRRRKARILAFQTLYQLDLTHTGPEETLTPLLEGREIPEDVRHFAETLIRGVCERMVEINELIKASSENWRLERMALVDRNILRLAVYELMFHPEIPASVTINEAIELGKRFSTEESGAFINGVLDQIRLSLLPLEAAESP